MTEFNDTFQMSETGTLLFNDDIKSAVSEFVRRNSLMICTLSNVNISQVVWENASGDAVFKNNQKLLHIYAVAYVAYLKCKNALC